MTDGRLVFEWRDSVPHASFIGDIDYASVSDVDEATLENYRTDGPLVVDLRQCTFLDSTGLGLLIRLRGVSDHVRIRHVPNRIWRLFSMTGVTNLFVYEGDAADTAGTGRTGTSA